MGRSAFPGFTIAASTRLSTDSQELTVSLPQLLASKLDGSVLLFVSLPLGLLFYPSGIGRKRTSDTGSPSPRVPIPGKQYIEHLTESLQGPPTQSGFPQTWVITISRLLITHAMSACLLFCSLSHLAKRPSNQSQAVEQTSPMMALALECVSRQ